MSMLDNELDGIFLLDKPALLSRLHTAGIEHCDANPCSCDVDDLVGLLYSYSCSMGNFEELYELADHFNEPLDLVQALSGDNGTITSQVVEQLMEQGSSAIPSVPVAPTDNENILCSSSLFDSSTSIIAVDSCDSVSTSDNKCLCVRGMHLTSPAISVVARRVLKAPLPFGMHNLCLEVKHCKAEHDSSEETIVMQHHHQKVLITSPVYRFVAALEDLHDRMLWGWEGTWTETLEAALLELVISVDEDLTTVVESLTAMLRQMPGEASAGASEMQQMLTNVQKDVQRALTCHSTYAVGRLHQTLVQFEEMQGTLGGFVRVPPTLLAAINGFIEAKLAASMDKNMVRKMHILVSTATEFRRLLEAQGLPLRDRYWYKLRDFLTEAALAGVAEVASTEEGATQTVGSADGFRFSSQLAQRISALKPTAMETFGSSIEQWHNRRVDHLPLIPASYLHDPRLLAQCARHLSETLLFEAIQLHSFLGYSLTQHSLQESASLICALLNAGIAYVASESGKLLGLLPMQRSMLVLNRDISAAPSVPSIPAHAVGNGGGDGRVDGDRQHISTDNNWSFVMPEQLRKRAKDMKRIFRNNVKQPLSLRLNTAFAHSVARLREHHAEDCWVGSALEEVWRYMCGTAPLQMLIFELWYGETLIAADFAHAVNGDSGVYVATRFFDRSEECKRLMPGFLLALAETKFLRDRGCKVWDLGTANTCPLMRYKLDLTGEPLNRPEAMYELACAKVKSEQVQCNTSKVEGNGVGPSTDVGESGARGLRGLKAGILVENITVADLLS